MMTQKGIWLTLHTSFVNTPKMPRYTSSHNTQHSNYTTLPKVFSKQLKN